MIAPRTLLVALLYTLPGCSLVVEADLRRLEAPDEDPSPGLEDASVPADDDVDEEGDAGGGAPVGDAGGGTGCPRDLVDCDDGPGLDCRDTAGDPNNCGGCNWVCWGQGARCERAACD